ncbi:Crp/Fnr family transcriptional regulator [Octadecabacter sp.]|nr:Crp/Fnr family transcriptional regulator [Octadecabacter sp.]
MKSTLIQYQTEGTQLSVPNGHLIFAPGDESRAFLIVKKGVVRVEQTNAAGRTVVLYRVEAGDSCVLTTTCLLSDRPYSGFGYSEGEVEAIAISPDTFRRLLRTDPVFQERVFQGFSARVGELTDVIDELLEHRTDLRLARWLASRPAPLIKMTQAEIAQELGTAREVISRALKTFEDRGWISVGRGQITVMNRDALQMHGTARV